jgi:hypothetical protein
MAFTVVFWCVFLASFSITLVCGLKFGKVLWGSFMFAIAFTAMCAMMGTTLGDSNTIETNCPDLTYEFDSVSADMKIGYKKDGGRMQLPSSPDIVQSNSCMLVVTGRCLFRKRGWWSRFDVLSGRPPHRIGTNSTLYVKRK